VSRELVEVEYTGGKILVKDFSELFPLRDVYHSDVEILVPYLKYPTNDAWEIVTCLSKGNGYPLLMGTNYGKGVLYILTIPDNFNDLYYLPPQVLNTVRRAFSKNLKINLEGPSRVCIFLYDNDTFILHSFLTHPSAVNIAIEGKGLRLRELISEEVFNGFERNRETVFQVYLQPSSYRAFRVE
jgi:hypothetical protein